MNWPDDYIGKIIQGDCREILKQMPEESVQCCITSPPYWGLRDYGLEPLIWGGREDCQHVWGDEFKGGEGYSTGVRTRWQHGRNRKDNPENWEKEIQQGQFCQLCGAWRGDLGLEPNIGLYVSHLVEIFREVRRVLRKDGILWLNLGDSYAGSGSPGGDFRNGKGGDAYLRPYNRKGNGLKSKDLCEIPSEIAKALRADGWYLRSRMPWLKRNSMPGSEKDRPSGSGSTVEYVFLLSKSRKYFYDNEAVRVKYIKPLDRWAGNRLIAKGKSIWDEGTGQTAYRDRNMRPNEKGRERRPSDWFFESWQGLYEEYGEPLAFIVNSKSYSEAHFAKFPEALIRPMILAGTSEKGCCSKCGAPWGRIIEKTGHVNKREPAHVPFNCPTKTDSTGWKPTTRGTNNWRPTCSCDAEIKPCVVLDPFIGSGTTAVVAAKLGRNFIGIDLSSEYCEISEKRLKPYRNQLKLAFK